MDDDRKPAITVTENGPYLVSGAVPLTLMTIGVDAEGGSSEWLPGRSFATRARYALCRCGQSATKPFCDGTHARIGFDGTETASRAPYDEQAETIEGPALTLQDAGALCSFARYCDPHGSVWGLVPKSDDPGAREIAVREAMDCPSGRLVIREAGSSVALEPKFEPSIALIEDPAKECSGPLWVRGGIEITSADGTAYEIRNRVTLCRCGVSKNKPFCDGAHADVAFRDGL